MDLDTGPKAAGDLQQLSRQIALSRPYRREIDNCWTIRLTGLAEAALLADMADGDETPRRSSTTIHEDGRPLGPAHAPHAEIRQRGTGAFSHWNDTLYFSTSDNSDPNTNGRRYDLVIALEDTTATTDAAAEPASQAPSTSPAGRRDRQCLFQLAGFVPDGGLAVRARLPIDGDGEAEKYRSPLVVLEDGVPLGPAHAPHAEIRKLGRGRYSHWGGEVYLSSSDGSDPRLNGRVYHAYRPDGAGVSAAASQAIERLRTMPESYSPSEAYAAVEGVLRLLHPSAIMGDPHKTFWHEEAFALDYHRICGLDRRSMERKFAVYQLVKGLRAVPGDLAECGCYVGGTAYFMALAGRETGRPRRLHIFDSFEGLSPPTEYDGDYWTAGNLAANEETLRGNLAGFDQVHVYKGWIPERFAEVAKRRFCFVHVDVDLYEPTRDSLAFFYDRLEPGGILLCDDYGSTLCPGARKAMDEFFQNKPEHIVDLPTEQGFVIKSNGAGARRPRTKVA